MCVNVFEHTASIVLKEDAVPIFIKPRVIPYGICEDVKTEIDRLVSDNVLVKVNESDWATPIVPIRKFNEQVCICEDYKVTLNPQLCDTVTTTPSMEDIVNNTNGSKWFSEIYFEYAYHQVPLDD